MKNFTYILQLVSDYDTFTTNNSVNFRENWLSLSKKIYKLAKTSRQDIHRNAKEALDLYDVTENDG